jgi:hypothetical protein
MSCIQSAAVEKNPNKFRQEYKRFEIYITAIAESPLESQLQMSSKAAGL